MGGEKSALSGEDAPQLGPRARWRARFPVFPARIDTPLGSTEPRFLARWLGTLLLLAFVFGVASLLMPQAPYSDVPLAEFTLALVGGLGAMLLLGALNGAPPWVFQAVLAFAIGLTSLGAYAGGSPVSGVEFFYLWITPYAFAFFSKREAAVQVVFIGAGYATVLAVQLHLHPHIGTSGEFSGLWFLTVVTCVVVGVVIRRLARAMRDVDRRARRAFVDSPIGAAMLTEDLNVFSANDAFCEMVGRDRPMILNTPLANLSHPDDVATIEHVIAGLGEDTLEYEHRFLLPSGSTVWSRVAIARITPEVGYPYYFLQTPDISAQKRSQETLAHQAIHDPLTGLFNRTLFLDRLGSSLRRRDQVNGEVAVIMLDLDRFKDVNDTLGHQVGDQLLQQIAPRLERALTPGDTIARFGGDEFVILCDELRHPDEAAERAQRLLDALRLPISLPTGTFTIAASLGIAVATPRSSNAAQLISDADAALYRAKAEGRGRLRVYDHHLRAEIVARIALEHELRDAIERDELSLDFQPIVDLASGKVNLVEALVRWEHPLRGRLMPADFLPIAEETGVIYDLDATVLDAAAAQLQRFHALFREPSALRVTVNVSNLELADVRFVDRLASTAARYGLEPRSIGIEITESVLLGSPLGLETLEQVRALGCPVLLDDFGTGYSSLSHLEQVRVDMIKIDPSFTARLAHSRPRRTVFEAIVQMCEALGVVVIAEGVEDEDQLRLMGELGCSLVQGRCIAAPAPAEALEALIRGGTAPLYFAPETHSSPSAPTP